MPVVAAATVFLFACGSSSVPGLLHIGHPGRWIALVALLVASAAWAAGGERRLAVRPGVAAASIFLAALAVVSTTWSVAPRITLERAVTIAVLELTALLVAQAVAGRRSVAERVLGGLLAGSALVALAGIVVYLLAHRDAVEISTPELPPRFKGMGQNPNTASLLFGVAMPIAVWFVVSARTPARRIAAGAMSALLLGSIVASGSHGALLAGTVGSALVVVVSLGRLVSRVAAVAAVAAVAILAFWIETLPQPSRSKPPAAPAASQPPAAKPGYVDAEINTPLDGELGIPLPGQANPRTLTTSSGRTEAWGGAIRQAEQRPVAGYGFGTESRVFIDRWWTFTGGVPENSYIGIALQLGVAGLLAFGALLVALGRGAFGAFRRDRAGIAAAGIGVLGAGLTAAIGQSFVYSVGDIATATFWIAAFLLAGVERTDG